MIRLAIPACLALTLVLAASPTQDQGPRVHAEGLDGAVRSLALADLELATLGPAEALLRFDPSPAARRPDGGLELHLRTGGRVLGRALGGGEEHLELELVGGTAARFSLEEVALVLAEADRDRLEALPPAPSGDRLWRRASGGYDPLDGFLLGFDADGVAFEGELGERLVPWSELAALHVEALDDLAGPVGDVEVDLVDGSRLAGTFAGLSGSVLRLDRGGDAPLALDARHLLQVARTGPEQVFLGALAFDELGAPGLFGDGFGLPWPPRVDRAVGGGPLRVGGEAHARGLGVHAPSRLGFDLAPGGVLRGAVGVDDSVLDLPAEGSVVFRVHWNGEEAWESPRLTSGMAPVALPALDLAAGGRLELEVDPTDDSIPGDRADWLDLRVVRP